MLPSWQYNADGSRPSALESDAAAAAVAVMQVVRGGGGTIGGLPSYHDGITPAAVAMMQVVVVFMWGITMMLALVQMAVPHRLGQTVPVIVILSQTRPWH